MLAYLRFPHFLSCPINRSKSCEFPIPPKNFVPVIKPKKSELLPSPLLLKITDASTNATFSDTEEKEFSLFSIQPECPFEVISTPPKKRTRYSAKNIPQSLGKSRHSILSMLKIRRKYSQQ